MLDLLHVRMPLRHQGSPARRADPLHRRQPRPPVNKGVLCGKGSAGIMQHYSPARLRKPLKRVGERGAGEFVEIEWEEAIDIATRRLDRHPRAAIRTSSRSSPGRDQSQSLDRLVGHAVRHAQLCRAWRVLLGQHGGRRALHGRRLVLGVRRAGLGPRQISAAVRRRRGSRLQSDQDRPGQTEGARREDRFGQSGPHRLFRDRRSNGSASRPGTDGLFVLALVHELLRADAHRSRLSRALHQRRLARSSTSPGAADHGLFARDARRRRPEPRTARASDVGEGAGGRHRARLVGEFALADGRKAAPVFQSLAERYMDARYAPEAVAATCGDRGRGHPPRRRRDRRRRLQQAIELDIAWTDWAGRRHEKIVGRPVAMHAMRGISAHSNGFQTCRAIHLLQMSDRRGRVPGGFRFKAPYPKPIPPAPKPAGKTAERR